MHKYSIKVFKCFGLFTLPNIETETNTDEMGTEPYENFALVSEQHEYLHRITN